MTTQGKLTPGACYAISDGGNCKLDAPIFKYESKKGIHYFFRETRGGWTRTYTDAQLIGKSIQEVE